jgi:hypothetical protein
MSAKSPTTAIRVLGTIDQRHKLRADVPPCLSPGIVQLFVLQADLPQADFSEGGQAFEVERTDRGEYRLVPQDTNANAGTIEWLLACPEKDYFVPVASESTDAI